MTVQMVLKSQAQKVFVPSGGSDDCLGASHSKSYSFLSEGTVFSAIRGFGIVQRLTKWRKYYVVRRSEMKES
jgi:hypothetical protein